MKKLNASSLTLLNGGEASAWTCFGLGVAVIGGVLSGNPLGWLGAVVSAGAAYEGGCLG